MSGRIVGQLAGVLLLTIAAGFILYYDWTRSVSCTHLWPEGSIILNIASIYGYGIVFLWNVIIRCRGILETVQLLSQWTASIMFIVMLNIIVTMFTENNCPSSSRFLLYGSGCVIVFICLVSAPLAVRTACTKPLSEEKTPLLVQS